jgi:two-component system, NtrC family, response regulator PilR
MMSNTKVLIVDDEPAILSLFEVTLSRMDLTACTATNLATAQQLLNQQPIQLCLTDLRLPDGNGIELVHYIQRHHSEIPVAVITAHGNMEAAIDALKAGAFDFLNKPVELQTLRELIRRALRLQPATPRAGTSDEAPTLLGQSAAIERIRGLIDKLARSQAPVYISGESGTGKELVARLIHRHSPRHDGPFIAINCGAIPADLIESELFGHLKGSFSGATCDRVGLFKAANGGTLFLDEVADLPFELQVKLLRAIQERAIRPIGATHEEHIDVRILSATHHNLTERVVNGQFREDLFYRLNVIELQMPPLRDRPEDLPLLTQAILRKLSLRMGIPPPELTPQALERLTTLGKR